MKYLAMVLMSVFCVVGCTKSSTVVCDVSKAVSSLVAAQISTQLTCKNLDAVKATVDDQLVKLKICEAKPASVALAESKSAIGNAICAPVIDALTAGALTSIPSEWGCTGGPLTDNLKAQLLAACLKAI